jgi:hypothetical protein
MVIHLRLSVSSWVVILREMSRIAEPVHVEERPLEDDDYLAEFIKSLTPDDVQWLWRTILQSKPHLAD